MTPVYTPERFDQKLSAQAKTPFPQSRKASDATCEKILREMAFVLKVTQSVKKAILEEKVMRGVVG